MATDPVTHPEVAGASIVSGYFSPLHVGHLDLFHAARARTGHLVVIVNNDAQQVLKKGRVVMPDGDRLRLVRELRVVDDALLCIDDDRWIDRTFDLVRAAYPTAELEFCNGGDRSTLDAIPADEVEAARRNRITTVFGVGGEEKADSSSRILAALEEDPT